MRSELKVLGALCAMALIAAATWAPAQQQRQGQRRGGFFGQSNVLTVAAVPAVAKQLKLTEEQVALAKKLAREDRQQRQKLMQSGGDLTREARRERFQKLREQRQAKEKQLAQSIEGKKFVRLQQLARQATGLRIAFFDRDVRTQLEITREQQAKVMEQMRSMGDQFRAARGDREATAKLLDTMNEKLGSILTDDQKNSWRQMTGEPASPELLAKIRSAGARRRGQRSQ